MAIDIWNAPIVHLDEKNDKIITTSLADLWPGEEGREPLDLMVKREPPPWATKPEDGGPAVTSLAELYGEVKTPQTPECLHDWRQDWGFSGPICVCNKCGSWHHD